MVTITFPINRLAPRATSLKDVDAFIQEHQTEKNKLIVEINPTGIGEAFADYLESAGFTVKRSRS